MKKIIPPFFYHDLFHEMLSMLFYFDVTFETFSPIHFFRFAFVVQNDEPYAIGGDGKHLGYGGIQNSLAVEFDTYYNFEELEPYENHVSVHTRGWRYPNSANHTFSLGHTNIVPDLTNGIIRIR